MRPERGLDHPDEASPIHRTDHHGKREIDPAKPCQRTDRQHLFVAESEGEADLDAERQCQRGRAAQFEPQAEQQRHPQTVLPGPPDRPPNGL